MTYQHRVIHRIYRYLPDFLPIELKEDKETHIEWGILDLVSSSSVKNFKQAYLLTFDNILNMLYCRPTWEENIQTFVIKHLHYINDYRIFLIKDCITLPDLKDQLKAKINLICLNDISGTRYDVREALNLQIATSCQQPNKYAQISIK